MQMYRTSAVATCHAYTLPALFCLPPLLLVAYPLTNRVMVFFRFEKLSECLCKKLQVVTLKPLLDSFQGTFKDNMRFFARFLFSLSVDSADADNHSVKF